MTLNLLLAHFAYFLLLSFLFGLAVGSFLNVVIYRLPIMLQQSWRKECCEFLQQECKTEKAVNLMWPRSHCPHCQ